MNRYYMTSILSKCIQLHDRCLAFKRYTFCSECFVKRTVYIAETSKVAQLAPISSKKKCILPFRMIVVLNAFTCNTVSVHNDFCLKQKMCLSSFNCDSF